MAVYSPTLQVIISVAEKVDSRLSRDFREIENLQSSHLSAEKFAKASYQKAEEILLDNLTQIHSNNNILLPNREIIVDKNSAFRWVVNPLSGLINFAHAIPYFCFAIALEKKDSSGNFETVASLVSAPAENNIYYAEKGAGTYVANRRVRVSSRDKMKNAIVGMDPDLSSGSIEKGLELKKAIIKQTPNVRNFGSALLNLAYVAAGRFDACINFNSQICDTIIGSLLVKNAGGYVTYLDNKDKSVTNGKLLASNELLHKIIIDLNK